MRYAHRLAAALVAALLSIAAVSCGAPSRDGAPRGDGSSATLVFGALAAPNTLDPFFVSDGEGFRPAQQIFDTLITYKPGTAELQPGLATEWLPNSDFTQWTFRLRDGVRFHDGTPFDAAAVCANFDRWFQLSGAVAQSKANYYSALFEGFAHNAVPAARPPVYRGCRATDPHTAVISLNKAKGTFPAAFGLTPLSISSPAALRTYDADRIEKTEAGIVPSPYGAEHPTGTGPFKFGGYDRAANEITLVRNDDYWGQPAKLAKLVFKVVPTEAERRRQLRDGLIDGYDFPSTADWDALRAEGQQVLLRPVFNVLYLGINQRNHPALSDLRVRQAIAHAVDREGLVRDQLPERSIVASQFVPPTVDGFAPDLRPISYDPELARRLLAEAGQASLTVDFYYPTGVSRPYLPDSGHVVSAIAEDLRAVGITVNPVPLPWDSGYLEAVDSGAHDLHLLGWNGDYNDAGNFIANLFGAPRGEFGLTDPGIFAEVAAADAVVDPAGHAAAYEQVNRDLMARYLPAVPLASVPPALVVRENVTGLVPSPLTDERFVTVRKGADR